VSGRLIGDSWIAINPETDTFQAQADAKIKQALAGVRPSVNITPNVSQAALTQAITKIKAELNALSKGNNVVINANTSMLASKLAAIQAQAAATKAAVSSASTPGTSPNLMGQTNLATAINDLGKMDDRIKQLREDMSEGGATGQQAFNAISRAVDMAQTKLDDLRSKGIVTPDDIQQVTNLRSSLSDLSKTLNESAVAGRSAAGGYGFFGRMVATISHASIPLFASAMDKVSGSVIPGFGDVLMGALPHMLSYASGLHMMMEAVIEFSAVWIPAGIAMGAFVLAAVPEAMAVGKQLENMNSIAKATGSTFADFPKLTGALTTALKPQLLELYGIALQGVDSSSGKLGPALDQVAKGVDNVAARIVAWTQNSSGGLEKFIKSGSQDAGLLADAFVQLGRTLSTILQSVPGYAKMLLEFGDACLTVLADVTKFIQPAIALFLKLHGAIFYLGIATTLVASFGTAFLSAMTAVAAGNVVEATTGKLAGLGSALGSLVGSIAAFAVKTVIYTQALIAMASEEGVAAAATKVFADGMEAIPFGPVGLAVAAFGAVVGYGLYTAFNNSETAAQKFNAQMQKMVAQSNYLDLLQNIQVAIAATGAKLSDATNIYANLTTHMNENTKAAHDTAASYGGQAQYLTAARAAITQYSSGLGVQIEQFATASIRQNDLAKSYGNTSSALGLMNLVGVKASSLATDSASQYHLLQIQLQGAAQGYGLMTTQAGAAGNQLATINIATSAAVKALSNLTTAESAWLTLTTGGVNALQSFESGMTNLTRVQKGSRTATLGQQAAFAAQVQSAGQVLTSLQGLAQASGNTKTSQTELSTAMKGVIGQMLPFAKGSTTNTAVLSSLAQLVGGPATDNFQTLAKWVGNTKDAQNQAITATDNLTKASSNLTSAEKNLAQSLSNAITQAQTAAIMQGTLTTATDKFHTAMDNSNDTLSTAVKVTGLDYYNALVKATGSTQTATQYTDAFMKQQGYTSTQINEMNQYLDKQGTKLKNVQTQAQQAQQALNNYAKGSPYNANVTTTVSSTGTVQVKGAGPGLNDVLAHVSFSSAGHFAGGGIVPGGAASVTGDNHLAMVKSGEMIVPSQHAPKFADMARRSGIAGYAAGGTIPGGASDALSKVSAGDTQGDNLFTKQSIAAAAKAMSGYMQKQLSSMAGAGAGGTPVGWSPTGGVNQWKSVVLKALALNGLPASLLSQVLYQMQTESGGNPNAVNNWDSNAKAGNPSQGLLQTIPSTFAAYHIAGTSGNILNPLANVAAAINYAKHVYGPGLMNSYGGLGSGHGYSAGGVTPEGIIGTGMRSGTPYTIGSGEYVGPLMGNSANAMGLTGGSVGLLLPILQEQNNLLRRANQIASGQPQNYAQGLNNAVGQGARRAYFQTGG
jgi:hypothetical protein